MVTIRKGLWSWIKETSAECLGDRMWCPPKHPPRPPPKGILQHPNNITLLPSSFQTKSSHYSHNHKGLLCHLSLSFEVIKAVLIDSGGSTSCITTSLICNLWIWMSFLFNQYIQHTQSSISIHLQTGFWIPSGCKSNIYSIITFLAVISEGNLCIFS